MDCWFFGMYVFLSFFKIGDLIEVSLVISYGQSLIVLYFNCICAWQKMNKLILLNSFYVLMLPFMYV